MQEEPIHHIKHVNKAKHGVNAVISYDNPSRKSVTISVKSPIGKGIKSRFIIYKSRNS